MAKQFKYIDTAGKSQTIQANSADEAMKNASNIASNSGVMAVDTLSRPADTRVDRGVEVVNNFQTRNASPALRDGISRSISTPPPQEVVRSEKDQQRDLLLETTQDILGTDIVSQRQQAREDAGVIEKEKRARLLSDQLTKRDREIQKQLEKLEQNPQGKGDFALDADIARFNRESARELADLSFSYNVALGDYQSAEKIANEYISDIQADLTNKQNAWQMLYQLVQNDMTESEKIQAQQNFQREQTQEQFELSKKMATFNQEIAQNDPLYKLSIRAKELEIAETNQAIENAKIAREQGFLTEDQLKSATDLRKEANTLAEVKATKELEPNIVALISSLEKENGVGDIAAINSFQRLAVDPGVAVREGDVALLQTAQSFGDQAFLKAQGLFKGNKLTPEARQQMKQLALDIYEARVNFTEDNLQPIKTTAQEMGIDYNKYIGRPFSSVDEIKNRVGSSPAESYVNEVDTLFTGQANTVTNYFNLLGF